MKPDLFRRAVVALGSNQGASEEILRRAANRLRALSSEPICCSSIWRTEPVDCPPGSPSFLNAVVALAPLPGERPETLLAKLQALEREFGRVRTGERHAVRTLDLDLLFFAGETRLSGDLTLPHPRWAERRFVLAPLAELDPDFMAPGQRRTVGVLLADLSEARAVSKVVGMEG